MTTKHKENRMCTECKNVNRKLEWNNRRWGENRLQSKQSEKCRMKMSNYPDAKTIRCLKSYLHIFFQCKRMSVRRNDREKMIQKEFQELINATKDNIDTLI